MTVKELINQLSQYPPDTVVVVPGYEWNVDDLTNVRAVRLVINESDQEDRAFAGAHCVTDDAAGISAVYLHGHHDPSGN